MLTAMIFTLNEEVHLPACLDALKWCDDIVVIDSYSIDHTAEICRQRGARFFQRVFDGFGSQRNWALQNIQTQHPWILILDADERVTPALAQEIGQILREEPHDIAAYSIKRRLYFWGRWLRYSSHYPTWVVRLIHKDRVRYVNRGHAETQTLDGRLGYLANDLVDENRKGLDEWFERHNRYSSAEAAFELSEAPLPPLRMLWAGDPLERRAALKRVARDLPGRALWYFLYSYVWKRGFLDGRAGLVFCLLKTMYQHMIVIKKQEARARASARRAVT